MEILIDLHYLPNTLYFSILAQADKIVIEQHENFVKQTYRNRAHILTSSGVDVLSIPLIGSQKKISVSNIKIDYKQKWVNRHWRAIQTAYGKSPFFLHYKDVFKTVLFSQYETLFELNFKLLSICLELLEIKYPVYLSEVYEKTPSPSVLDLRSAIHPKKPFHFSKPPRSIPYHQVFGKGFVENLSIVDLIFAEGPNSGSIIREQISH